MDRAVAPHVPAVANFRDGLGERRRISDAGGDTIELLCVRRELTAVPSFEFALRERASRLASFRHETFARVRSIDRLSEPTAALAVVSDFTRGVRLSHLLTPKDKRPVTIDITVAQHLIKQIVTAVAALHESARDIAHGAISPERIIVTANARVAVVEYVLGAALEQLRYSPERYWKELRIALPPGSGAEAAAKFDHRADVTQIGMVALALVLGRTLTDGEHPAKTGDVLASAQAISSRGGLEPLSPALRDWIGRALQLDGDRSFASALEARAALDKTLSMATPKDAADRTARLDAKAPGVRETTEAVRPSQVVPAAKSAAPLAQPVSVVPPPSFVMASSPIPVALASAPNSSVVAADSRFVARPHEPAPPAAAPERKPAPVARTQQPIAPVTAARPISSLPAASDVRVRPLAAVADEPLAAALHALTGELPSFEPVQGALEPATIAFRPAKDAFPDFPDEDAAQESGTKRRWKRLAVAAGVVAALAAAGMYGGRRFFATPMPPANTGTLNVASNPPGAQVFVDRQGRGMTPLVLTLRPGPHSIEFRGIGEPRTIDVNVTPGTETSQFMELVKAATGPTQQARTDVVDTQAPRERSAALESALSAGKPKVDASPAAPVAGSTAGTPSAPVSGWITLTAPVDVEIREHDKLLGTSQTDRIMVAAGRHELELVNDTLGYRATAVLQVAPGKVAPIKIEWPKGKASLNAEPWAEVWIDGEKIGDTPIGNLSLPIGPHEVMFRHPELGEQRHAVSVSLKAPARLSVDMRKQP